MRRCLIVIVCLLTAGSVWSASDVRPFVIAPSAPQYRFDEPEPAEPTQAGQERDWRGPDWHLPDWNLPDWQVPEWFESATAGVSGRLSVGTRMVAYALLKEDGDYLGSIDHLDAKQDLWPNRVFVDWLFSPRWGVELTWDRIEMSTITTSDGHNDGDITAEGPILTAVYRHPNSTIWTPYAGVGLAMLNGSFDPEEWWHLHYPSKYYWELWGKPQEPLGGITKELSIDDTVAFVITGGCDAELTEHLSAGIYGRFMWGDVTSHYQIFRYGSLLEDRGHSDFPIDNFAMGLGVTYRF